MQQRHKEKVGPSAFRVRPPLPDGIILLQLRNPTHLQASASSSFAYKVVPLSIDKKTTSAKAVSNQNTQLNSPKMGYGSTSPSQSGSDPEKYTDTADLSTQGPSGELLGSSNGVTTADKPSPRNIHGWKVSVLPYSLYTKTHPGAMMHTC